MIPRVEIIDAVTGLLKTGWCQGHEAQTKTGEPIGPASPKAVAWCIVGGFNKIKMDLQQQNPHRMNEILDDILGAKIAVRDVIQERHKDTSGSLPLFNDTSGRTLEEVISVLHSAKDHV